MFVGIFDPLGVQLAHAHKLGEYTKNGLYHALSFALHTSAAWGFQPLFGTLVVVFIIRDGDSALGAFAYTFGCKWATLALARFGEIELLFVVAFFLNKGFTVGYFLIVTTQPIVAFLVVLKMLGTALVGAMWRYESFQAFGF